MSEPTRFALDEEETRIFLRLAQVLFAPMPGGDALAVLGPRELEMGPRLAALVARLPSDADRMALKAMLRLAGSRAGGLALIGRPVALTALSDLELERTLLAMLGSERALARQLARLVRTLVGVLVGHPLRDERGDVKATQPVWDAIGYPGPLGPAPETPRRLHPLRVSKPATWTADVVIVGSGAGGGVAAGVLAKAGLDVVVLERGPYKSERDFTHYQDDADRDLYDVRTTIDLGVSVLSGRCVGGGTVVNYATALRTPDAVRDEWDREAGFRGVFTGRDFSESLDTVCERIGVTSRASTPAKRDRVIEAAAHNALGWDVDVLTRNVRGCAEDERCGFCNFGCRLGAKQSSLRTWLEDATGRGARLVAECEVDRVILESGRAVAVRGHVRHGGERVALTVFAKAIVIACGAPYTPVLLARSGLSSPALGQNLRLHPVTGVWGLFPDEDAVPWGGVMQARIGRDLADLDGRGYGVRIESAAIHPTELAVLQGWGGSYDYKEVLRRARHWVPLALLVRDRSRGHVSAPRWGPTSYHYELSAIDVRHVRHGVEHAARALAAAGATEIRTATSRPVVWRPSGGEPLTRFLSRVDGHGYGANQTTYGSFHPSGTAAMGSDRRRSVCDETNQVHGVPGLYVMDASCFPTPSGVNPMVSIEAIAHRAARALASTLGRG
ncbi:MAG: GMC family oxidoreductase [Sandaracinaceae bacterium]|nr:GMC family oxidoreductase [Sandaracinaceae bacterium]